MSFIWPSMLLSLLSLPMLVVLYMRKHQQRRKFTHLFSGPEQAQEAAAQRTDFRRYMPPGFFLIGLALLMLALARPEMVLSLPKVEGTVILAFDVSGSMAADDLEPTRIEAAKAAAREFIEHQPSSILIGVVAFSDSGFTVQAPTNDQEAIFSTIDRLAPERGTSLANGIFTSLTTIEGSAEQTQRLYSNLTPAPSPTPTPVPQGIYSPAVILLLTDGENNESPDPRLAAEAAADRGVRIHTIGIGSTAGTTLEINGFSVHTQLNEAMLQQISQITEGTYYKAENAEELRKIYENLDPQLVIKPEKMEVTSIFSGASILAMLIGGMLSLLWFSRAP